MEDMSDEPWLSDRQQQVWRAWLEVSAALPAALHQQLQGESTLSLQDFEVLVHLTEAPDGRLRVTDLARALKWERSRLSHHIKRMEARGLVERLGCESDRRGAFVLATRHGRAAIEAAAPGHAATVRELFFEPLSDADLEALDSATSKLRDRLASHAAATGCAPSVTPVTCDAPGRETSPA